MQEPTFEDMIPWSGGECPWDEDVYYWMEDDDYHCGPVKGKYLIWDLDGGITAYMPVRLWEEGFRRHDNMIFNPESTVRLNIYYKDGRTALVRQCDVDWSQALLWKPFEQAWNPTADTLDDMAKHCEENMEEIMTDNRPLDFMGSPLFGDESLEDLFSIYKGYKQEKESAENMMAKVLQEVEYRTPDEWNIGLKNKEEESSEVPEEAVVNDWQNWGEGDILKCVYNGGRQRFSEGVRHEIVSYDEDDSNQPVLLVDNCGDHHWVELSEYHFIKVEA